MIQSRKCSEKIALIKVLQASEIRQEGIKRKLALPLSAVKEDCCTIIKEKLFEHYFGNYIYSLKKDVKIIPLSIFLTKIGKINEILGINTKITEDQMIEKYSVYFKMSRSFSIIKQNPTKMFLTLSQSDPISYHLNQQQKVS